MKEAILEYPNLIRVVEGQVRSGVVLDRFERRQVDVCEWEGILAGLVEGRGVEEVFGGWWNWRWGPSAVSWVEPLHGSLALPDGDPWHLDFLVDMNKLLEYASSGQDARQPQVEQFVQQSAGGRRTTTRPSHRPPEGGRGRAVGQALLRPAQLPLFVSTSPRSSIPCSLEGV